MRTAFSRFAENAFNNIEHKTLTGSFIMGIGFNPVNMYRKLIDKAGI
jgi:hypothetical protein